MHFPIVKGNKEVLNLFEACLAGKIEDKSRFVMLKWTLEHKISKSVWFSMSKPAFLSREKKFSAVIASFLSARCDLIQPIKSLPLESVGKKKT